MFKKAIRLLESQGIITRTPGVGGFGSVKVLSTPMAVDVSAAGMKKKNLARGTGVTYSGIRTSSQGLLTGAKTEKKTLLGG
jgi:DNA-binding GntR family transcriptional regulator